MPVPVPIILIAEHIADDIFLLELALRRGGVSNPVQLVSNGQEATEYLTGAGKYANRVIYPVPGLVITDFSLPRLNAVELLRCMRQHPELAAIPVVVLVESNCENDLTAARRAGATLAIPKGLDLMSLLEQIKAVWQGWHYING